MAAVLRVINFHEVVTHVFNYFYDISLITACLAHVTSSDPDPDKSFAWPVLRSKFTNQRISTFFNNGEFLYLYEEMYNDCFYNRSGAFFCNYLNRIC